jgi:hypothetical protein
MPCFLAPGEKRLAVAAAFAVALLCFFYAVVLAVSLLTLPSPTHQIRDPWFTLMESLIIAIAPAMVVLTIGLHSWAPLRLKPFALTAGVFMGMCAAVTCTVHFGILTLARQPSFAQSEWAPMVFSFQWPSVAYALDIVAWDFFFAIPACFAAASIDGAGLAGAARKLLYVSGALAFAGLAGIPLANMQVRNIGIIGYAVLFPVAAALLGVNADLILTHFPA